MDGRTDRQDGWDGLTGWIDGQTGRTEWMDGMDGTGRIGQTDRTGQDGRTS